MSADSWQAIFSLGSLLAAAWAVYVAMKTSKETVITSQNLQRIETFQRVHELLVQPAAAGGRKLLLLADKTASGKDFPHPGDSDWDQINYSLALFDTLGAYYFRGEVNQKDVIASWAQPLAALHPSYENFIAHRRGLGIYTRWRFLDNLMRDVPDLDCVTCKERDLLETCR